MRPLAAILILIPKLLFSGRAGAGPGNMRCLLAVLALLLCAAPFASLVSAQVSNGATMTVLRGQVTVLRPDGSVVQPAPSGTTVFAGDEIRTLTETGALITFFSGTEIELGAETILVVQQVSREGDSVQVSLRQVLGVTVNRVAALVETGSSYSIQAGGSVAVVRGTTFAVGVIAPFAAIGCVGGSLVLDIAVCQPGQLLWWEFDPATGARSSAFGEKSIPAGNLGAALNAVVSTLGELADQAEASDDEDDEDGPNAQQNEQVDDEEDEDDDDDDDD